MTTFHDPPPQSRRAARLSERERVSDEQPTVEGFTTFPSQEDAEDRVDETQTNPSDAATRATTPPASGAAAAAPRAAGETNERPSAPASTPRETDAPERTLTRRELRELRARQEAERAGVAPAAVRGSTPTPDANAAAPPHYPYSGSVGQASTPPSPQPLTVDSKIPAYIEPPALIDPLSVVPEAASVSAPTEDALSAFESLLANADGSAKDTSITDAPRSPLVDPQRDAGPAKSAAELNFGDSLTPAPPEQSSGSSARAAAAQQPESVTAPKSKARPTIAGLLGLAPKTATEHDAEALAPTAAAAQTNLGNARAEFDELARKRLDGELPPVIDQQIVVANVEGTPAAPNATPSLVPAGHWSRQAAAEDEPSDSVVARTIGSGTSTTSALVLQAIPFATDIRGPLNSSGEAMLTGSIDLPSTLSASGVSDRFDRADIDSLLDLNDSDMVSTDSAPVRAVKAVSTFSNQAVIQTQKPKGTRALTVLLISASSMAVVVAGLLVAAFAFNML